MRHREPFSLYRRKNQKGSFVWYYRTYDEYGNRTTGKSTGEASKTKARQYCAKLIERGELVPIKEISFPAYTEDWWKWDKCQYVRGKLARSKEGKPRISHRYVDDQRRLLELHILPYFEKYRLSSINPQKIESFMFWLQNKGISHKRSQKFQ